MLARLVGGPLDGDVVPVRLPDANVIVVGYAPHMQPLHGAQPVPVNEHGSNPAYPDAYGRVRYARNTVDDTAAHLGFAFDREEV